MVVKMKAVMVASGKGGVGKTLISINLARALASMGAKVALVDADLSNPSVFQMLGVQAEAKFSPDMRIYPTKVDLDGVSLEVFSIESVSKGRGIYKIGSEYAKILSEILRYGQWNHDLFVVDAPAGIGDEHKVTVAVFDRDYAGTIVVGVPAHASEVRRVLEVHRVNDIPVLGVIENMAGFKCECGKEYHFFPGESLEEVAKEFGVPFFGSIPLDHRITENLPWIPEDVATPIKLAAEAALNAEPRRPGFIEEIKSFMKDKALQVVLRVLPRVLYLLNKTVPIAEIQKKFNLPGGRLIALNLTYPDMTRSLCTFYFMVKDGKIVMFKHVDPSKTPPYAVISIYHKALAWAVLGHKKDGTPYDFWTAFWNDHIRVSTREGPENIQAFYFLATCLEYAKQYSGGELQKLMEVMA